jgi:hypothetical protein
VLSTCHLSYCQKDYGPGCWGKKLDTISKTAKAKKKKNTKQQQKQKTGGMAQVFEHLPV